MSHEIVIKQYSKFIYLAVVSLFWASIGTWATINGLWIVGLIALGLIGKAAFKLIPFPVQVAFNDNQFTLLTLLGRRQVDLEACESIQVGVDRGWFGRMEGRFEASFVRPNGKPGTRLFYLSNKAVEALVSELSSRFEQAHSGRRMLRLESEESAIKVSTLVLRVEPDTEWAARAKRPYRYDSPLKRAVGVVVLFGIVIGLSAMAAIKPDFLGRMDLEKTVWLYAGCGFVVVCLIWVGVNILRKGMPHGLAVTEDELKVGDTVYPLNQITGTRTAPGEHREEIFVSMGSGEEVMLPRLFSTDPPLFIAAELGAFGAHAQVRQS